MAYGYIPTATVTLGETTTVHIFETINNTYLVKWDDSVANQWEETYTTLSSALARAAALAACGETGWEKTLNTVNPELFQNKAEHFLQQETI